MHLPAVSVGAMTGVAVRPPGQKRCRLVHPEPEAAPDRRCRSAASREARPSPRRSQEVVGHAGNDRDLLRSGARRGAADNQRREERVHLPRLVVQLDLPEQLHVLRVASGQIVSFCCHAVRRESAPSVSQFAGVCCARIADVPAAAQTTTKADAEHSGHIGASLISRVAGSGSRVRGFGKAGGIEAHRPIPAPGCRVTAGAAEPATLRARDLIHLTTRIT